MSIAFSFPEMIFQFKRLDELQYVIRTQKNPLTNKFQFNKKLFKKIIHKRKKTSFAIEGILYLIKPLFIIYKS